ncbi:hypothetical protein Ahy_Scaffold1g106862 [Arachis hypogaea]|uniref:Uncharacterized protein n=1 Tax=Arachis hypogaea TaxID=3818 RepID=A0A444WSR8_ARAHY|nr:hypothetical protein Ahy_Scaffold1g106862 [Arachis hypogaea]
MCYRVDCKTCGKYTWGGCGRHLNSLYNTIDEQKRCDCRPWPGVAVTPSQPAPPQSANPSQGPNQLLCFFNIIHKEE